MKDESAEVAAVGPNPAPSLRRRPRSAGALASGAAPWFFLLPNGLGFLALTLLPLLAAILLAFCEWDLGPRSLPHFIGLTNFKTLAADADFWRYLGNTLFLMLGIPINIIGAFLVANLLHQQLRGISIYRTLLFLPTMCSPVAVYVLWQWIFHYRTNEVGLLDAALMRVGIANPPDWLGDPLWAKPALILVGAWIAVGGYNCVLYLAGLQNVPDELYEAAALDGAGWFQRLRHITWPSLYPTTFFILIMSIISGFQGGFTAVYLMTKGGPAGATTTLIYYIYTNAFARFQIGYAAAAALVLFALVLGFTLLNWKYSKRVTQF
jgi:multiple sugar transport system permease protein